MRAFNIVQDTFHGDWNDTLHPRAVVFGSSSRIMCRPRRNERSGRRGPSRTRADALDLWLRAETAINDRWAMFAEEAYNVGVDAGLAMRVVDEVLADAGADPSIRPAAAMRALAAALARSSSGDNPALEITFCDLIWRSATIQVERLCVASHRDWSKSSALSRALGRAR